MGRWDVLGLRPSMYCYIYTWLLCWKRHRREHNNWTSESLSVLHRVLEFFPLNPSSSAILPFPATQVHNTVFLHVNLLKSSCMTIIWLQFWIPSEGLSFKRWGPVISLTHQECQWQAIQFLICLSHISFCFWHQVRHYLLSKRFFIPHYLTTPFSDVPWVTCYVLSIQWGEDRRSGDPWLSWQS